MKNNVKKIVVAGIMTSLLLPGMTGFAKANDIENHWAKESIQTLMEQKVIQGYEDGSFKPDNKITREEVSSIMNNVLKGAKDGKATFEDVKGRWSEGAIASLAEKKVINGYPDGTFKPAKDITREEFATILFNTLAKEKDLTKVAKKTFGDIDGSFAKDAIKTLAGLDIIKGYEEDKKVSFKPKNAITRAEVAKMVAHAQKNEVKPEEPKEPKEEITKEKIDTAKTLLKTYLETIKWDVLKDPAIDKDVNKKAMEELKKVKDRSEELLNDDNIDEKEYKEIMELPYIAVDGGKPTKGLFNKVSKKFLVDFEVQGDRVMENKDNHKKYPVLKDHKITVKTLLTDAGKKGEKDDRFLKLNIVTKAQYDAKTEADAVSGATPKYDKQELPLEDYDVKAVDGGYEFIIKKVPEDVVILKPIIYVKLGEGTYLENGDMVYIEAK